ncbi:DUF1343 domain-containing protein [Vicingaceae bacterium]|nr:DUF1343 domain-containing protein [Vicingaceae bacterium]MDB4061050.1 DUF1343 domain-containing protein [Vicingaceae bacterium]MDC1451854.1 DUF1343 domain-containing protein [Vicingaceae bacterium]
MNSQVMMKTWSIFFIVFQVAFACSSTPPKTILGSVATAVEEQRIVIGNERLEDYLPLISNKKVGFVGNHTSMIDELHLVDSLLNLGVNLVKVFSPEHGFRGAADAGEKVSNEIDAKNGLSIISLYGDNKKPSTEQLKDVEVLVFDIQDVGVRFYTYISTLHYVMEAAAERDIQVVVLDRPNPNGHYIDGPILEEKYKSFIGLHPVPVVHGMTIGEYAQMINGESWLKNGISCDLTVIKCKNYSHQKEYKVSVPPSPNLPNMNSIYLYPSLCFFEGTPISVGRGTDAPFQQFGHPSFNKFQYSFTPLTAEGAKNPKLNGTKCFGLDLSDQKIVDARNWKKLDLSYLIECYKIYPEKENYFTNFFNLLAGNSSLKEAIISGKTASEIRAGWLDGLANYQITREKYLLYKK